MVAVFKLNSTGGSEPDLYTCAEKCPRLHEEVDDSGVPLCSSCPKHDTKKVFDFSTGTCVVPDTGCPSNTVQMNATFVFPNLPTAANASVCVPCNEKCATCSPMHPAWCETCKSDFFTNHYKYTDADTGTETDYIRCQEKCKPGTFEQPTKNCTGMCLDDCKLCDDDKTCKLCKKGFFLDNITDSANHVCVPQGQCPAGSYGNMMSRKCEACDTECKECTMGAKMCTECPASKFLLAPHHKCFTKCPKGTYVNGTDCSPCHGNLLNCNQTTGMSDNPLDGEHCARNCDGCIWSKNYCINCADGYKKAANGRCIMECPAGTVEKEMNGFTYCQKCGDGCTKCIDEEPNCDGTSTPDNSTVKKEARCIRCDRSQDYFLFRDHCVQECPHGTYKDEVTGWCAKCSCNCGDGGCSDAHTCNTCTMPNTELDTESGMCKCKTKASAKWADDWQKFTITIESADVRFRDFKAEAMSNHDFSMKTCRIGNEPFKIGGKTYVNMDSSDLMNNTDFDASAMDPSEVQDMDKGMFGNRTGGNKHNITYDENHVPLNICGDWEERRKEMKHIMEEFGAMNIDYSGGMYGNTSGGMGDMSGGMGDMSGGMGDMSGGMNDTSGGMGDSSSNDTSTPPAGSDPSSNPPDNSTNMDDMKFKINDSTGYCPAHVPSYSMMDLYDMGIYSIEDVYWHMGSMDATFGNVTDEMLNEMPDPLEGLEFTEKPDDLCAQLFDNNTLWMLGGPTCNVTIESGKTVISIGPGKRSYIHSEMELYFKPNVFAEGCDFPVLTHLVVEDAAIPDSLEIAFDHEDDIPICEDFALVVESQGNIGNLYCYVGIQHLIDESGNEIMSEAAANLTNQIMMENMLYYGSGVYLIGATDITALYGEGARKIGFEGYCYDFFGQESYIESEYDLITQSSGIKMAFDVESIVYDTNFGEYAFFEFEFANCATGAVTELNVTVITQKVNSTGQWEDVTDPNEMAQGSFIPPGLSINNAYRLKVIVSAPDGSVSDKEFFVEIEMVIPEPYIILDDFSSFLPVNEDLEYVFIKDLFVNVEEISEATLEFDCKSCDGGKCMGQSGVLDFNALYNESNKTISVPSGTFAPDSCYEVEVAVTYKGMTGVNYGFIGTAGLSETSYEVQLNIQDGEFIKPSKRGRIECEFDFEENIAPENVTNHSLIIYDSSKEVYNESCITYAPNRPVVRYTKDCLQHNEIYYADCELEGVGPGGTGKGRRLVQFNTKSNLEATVSITPDTGNEFTEFTIDVQVTHDYGAECRLAYVDHDTDEFKKFGKKINVGANKSVKAKKQKLLPLTYGDGESVSYIVWCTSKVTDDEDFAILPVIFTSYSGDDLAGLQEAKVDEFTNSIASINFTDAGQGASSQAADAIGDFISASAGFGAATEAKADEMIKFVGEAIENLDFDNDEDLADLVVESIIAIGELIDEKVDPDATMKMVDVFETMLAGEKTARNLQTDPSIDDIRAIKTMSEGKIKQKSLSTCSSLIYAIGELMSAIDKGTKGSRSQKEMMTRKIQRNIPLIVTSCLYNLEEGSELQTPSEDAFFVLIKLPKDQASLSAGNAYEFDCPCSTGYGFEASPSSYKSQKGTAASTGARVGATTDSTTSNTDKCYVDIPGINDVDMDPSICSSLGLSIVTTKNMCPGQANNESDTSNVDFSENNKTLLESSDYQTSNYDGNFLDSSKYDKIQCTGPSLDVSFYCIKEKRPDKDNKLTVEKIDVPKFKNNKTISYKIGCSANQGSNSDSLVASYLDEKTGQTNVNGCKVDNTTGNRECAHLTTFGYSSTVSSTVTTGSNTSGSGKRDFGARIFENYIFYIMLLIDIYFIATLVYFFIAKKTNKNEIAVVDESKAMDEYNMKHPNKVEVASSMNAGEMRANNLGDGSSEHKSGEDNNDFELHKAGFCKKFTTGFMLKYRLLTPFTTAHPHLNRLSRGIINCLVLYFIWVISGILLLLIEKAGGSYGAAIPVCFIAARLATFALEILHKSSNSKAIEILSYCTAATLAIVLHASIFLITEDMGKEFDDWGLLLLTVLLIDLIVWELLSLLVQIYIGSKLASSPDNFSGKRKSLEKMMTPPLLKKFIDP